VTTATRFRTNGENVKVVQELMRHANSRCTLDVYSQAKVRAKREAQQRIVEMVIPDEELTSEINFSFKIWTLEPSLETANNCTVRSRFTFPDYIHSPIQ
jgi:hypothetical protein